MKWSSELKLAESAAIEAGNYLKNLSSLNVISSIGRDVKHLGDIDSEEIILKHLEQHSEYPVLAEETGEHGRTNSDIPMWVVDPLDGTLNFSRGIKFYCISIGLVHDENPILGVIYDFKANELFSGIVGQGAWCNKNKITASNEKKTENSVLATGFPVNRDFSSKSILNFIEQIRCYKKVRLLGSAALSLAYVSSGRMDAYMEEDIMFWDIAAGAALVKAAGGYISIENSNTKKWAKNVSAGEIFRHKTG